MAIHTIKQTPGQSLWSGVSQARFWGLLGWNDVLKRYRRSKLGPFWVTISMAVFISALGLVYSHLLNQPLQEYLPFLAVGYVAWFLISGVMNDSCSTFIDVGHFLKDIKLPLSLFAMKTVWRHMILLAHNLVVVLVVFLIFKKNPGWSALLLLPGLVLLFINLVWMSLLIGFMSTRYRDMTPIVQSVIQVVFFISPIAWMPQMIAAHPYIVEYNLINYFIDLVRQPLLGHAISVLTWQVVLATTLLGWVLTMIVYRMCANRLIYWL